MKTLIYDNECPLCVAYTGAFVKTGLLEKESRKHFNEVVPALLQNIDQQKCNNEIPLIDDENGKVWYGIDALLEILGNKFPFIKTIGNISPVNWFLKKLYKLVSYNRKVIVAKKTNGYDCSPDFNTRYRILFLVTGLVFNSFLFALFYPLFNKSIFSNAVFEQFQIAHFSFVGINICIAVVLGKQKGLEYLGQVNMLAFSCMLLLLPLHMAVRILGSGFINFSMGFILLLMMLEYVRRMKYAGILNRYNFIVALNIISLMVFFIYLSV
jgi:predicted DCC family thiol-disulfide oxidoreductase YuxK